MSKTNSDVRLDLTAIINEMSEEEKKKYFTLSTSKYFKWLHSSEKFNKIVYKLDNDYIIKEDEWIYLFKKLFAITCKAVEENEKISIVDKFFYMISKIGVRISKLDSSLYNECYKKIQYIDSIRMNSDINSDLFYGLEKTGEDRDYNDLAILMKQHITASNYREYKDLFYDSYMKSEDSNITYDERIAIDSIRRYYEKEKELVNRYKK